MLLFDGAAGLLFLGLWVFCIIDVITQPEYEIRNLPKLVWLLIVILLADIGSIAWLVAGRPWKTVPRPVAAPPQQPARPTNPDDDAEFLAQLRARAEEQRRRAREANDPEEPRQDS